MDNNKNDNDVYDHPDNADIAIGSVCKETNYLFDYGFKASISNGDTD